MDAEKKPSRYELKPHMKQKQNMVVAYQNEGCSKQNIHLQLGIVNNAKPKAKQEMNTKKKIV